MSTSNCSLEELGKKRSLKDITEGKKFKICIPMSSDFALFEEQKMNTENTNLNVDSKFQPSLSVFTKNIAAKTQELLKSPMIQNQFQNQNQILSQGGFEYLTQKKGRFESFGMSPIFLTDYEAQHEKQQPFFRSDQMNLTPIDQDNLNNYGKNFFKVPSSSKKVENNLFNFDDYAQASNKNSFFY